MNASAATFGTILGIVLTVGVTYWQQMKEQEEMTRKIAKITLHNIDVRLSILKERCETLAAQDSIFGKLQSYMPDRLEELGEDSLNVYWNILIRKNLIAQDIKSENIFSNSFDIWKYLDDERVIGRISNCYSFIDLGEKTLDDIEQKLEEAYHTCCVSGLKDGTYYDSAKFMKLFLSDPGSKAAYLELHNAYMLYETLGDIQLLNDINKHALGISQKELDALSNLLGDETKKLNYSFSKDSVEVTKDFIE